MQHLSRSPLCSVSSSILYPFFLGCQCLKQQSFLILSECGYNIEWWRFLSELMPLIVFNSCDYSSVRRKERDPAFLFNSPHYYSWLFLLLSFILVRDSIFIRLSYFRLQLRNPLVICYYMYFCFVVFFLVRDFLKSISVFSKEKFSTWKRGERAFSPSHWTLLLGTWVITKESKQQWTTLCQAK